MILLQCNACFMENLASSFKKRKIVLVTVLLFYFLLVRSQGSYSDLYPDSDDSSEDQIENSKNTWSCKVQHNTNSSRMEIKFLSVLALIVFFFFSLFHLEVYSCFWKFLIRASSNPKTKNPGQWWDSLVYLCRFLHFQ